MCIQTPTAIYMNGFGANGKLGFENEETVFTPKRVPSLSHPASQSPFGAFGLDTVESSDADKVVKVALGQNHTLILYKSGCIKSFGSNKFGQLGYESDNKSDSKFIPTTVSGPLKKLHVVDIAASKFHSVAVTDKNFLYTWGFSTGQLGYILAKDTPQYTPRKVGLKLPSSSSCIVGVSCTNFATAVVVETPVESTSNFLAVQAGRYTMLLVFVRDEEVKVNIKNIVSVTAGSGYFAVVGEDGDVCLVDVECVEKDWKKRVKKVWSGKRREGKAVGCTVGTKVLVLTQDGDVYEIDLDEIKRDKSNLTTETTHFPFTRIPTLANIISISASSSGQFAALRSDKLPLYIPPPTPSQSALYKSMIASGPKTNAEVFKNCDVVFESDDGAECIGAQMVFCSITSPAFQEILNKPELFFDGGGAVFCDLGVLTGREFECVRGSMRKSANQVFVRVYKEGKGRDFYRCVLCGCSGSVVKVFVEYLYTKTLGGDHEDGDTSTYQTLTYMEQQKVTQLIGLLKISKSGGIQTAAQDLYKFCMLYNSRIAERYFRTESVVVELCGGESVRCHLHFLVSGSEFFRLCVSGMWKGNVGCEGGGGGRDVKVGLRHVEKSVFDVVVRYIYGYEEEEELFEGVGVNVKGDVGEFAQFVVEVLAVADELMVDGLKSLCARLVSGWIDLGNVCTVLEIADMFDVKELKAVALEFMAWNLESLYYSRSLLQFYTQTTPPTLSPLLQDLQDTIQKLQLRTFPYTRGPNGYYANVSKRAKEDAERRKKERREAYEMRKRESLGSVTSMRESCKLKSVGGGDDVGVRSKGKGKVEGVDGGRVAEVEDYVFKMDEEVEVQDAGKSEVEPSSKSKKSNVTPKKKWTKVDFKATEQSSSLAAWNTGGDGLGRSGSISTGSSKGENGRQISSPIKINSEGSSEIMSASSKTPTRGWGTSPSSSNVPNLREILESSAASKQSPQTSKASGLSSSPPIPSSESPTKPGLNFAKTPIQTRPPNTQNSAISASSIQLKQSGLSQRERKKLEQQRNNANASPQPTQQQQTPPKPVWGKILQSEEKGKSVGSLSIFITPSPTPDSPSMVFSTSPPKSTQTVSIPNKQKSQSIHQQHFFSTPSSPPPIASSSSSQFKKPTPSSPPKATTSLFKKSILEIQREEQSEKQRIEKIKRSRPLTDIQKEERAVEALREYYEMTKEPGSGEWFEVVVGDTV